MKIISKICIILLCVFTLSGIVYAAENKKGSIVIELENLDHLTVSKDICLCITKVGDMKDGQYEFDSQYLVSDLNMPMDTYATVTNNIIHEMVSKVEPDKVVSISDSGIWKFDELEEGLYLIYEKESNEGISIEPCLITIPYYDQANIMQYEVFVFSKYSLLTPTPVPLIVTETGDSNNLEMLIIIMSIAAAGIVSVLMMKKYKKL